MSEAMRDAVDLLHLPSQARAMRAAPLPGGINLLLRVATGDRDALDSAKQLTKRSADVNRNAAAFFIEQVLLHSEDHHRNLGVTEQASPAERRAHMALLLKWLHPDVSQDAHKARLARRVIAAWNAIKPGSQGTQSQSDRNSRRQGQRSTSRKTGKANHAHGSKQAKRPIAPRPNPLRRLLGFLRSLRSAAPRP